MEEKINKLLDSVDNLDANKSNTEKLLKEFQKEISNEFLNSSSESVFITTVILLLLNPIECRINESNRFIANKRSRKDRTVRLNELFIKDFLIKLRNKTLLDYQAQFKSTKHFENLLLETTNRLSIILNPTQGLPFELFSSKDFETIIKESFLEVISYFEKQITVSENYKDELFLFYNKAYSKMKIISNDIIVLENIVKKLDKDDFDKLFEVENNISLLKIQNEYLIKLINRLENNNLFLKLNKPNQKKFNAVFNNCNITKIEHLFYELEFFLDSSIELDDIIKVFSVEYMPDQKINLRNGTTNDFAYLINKLYLYFIPEIANRNFYNKWWSERFKFNGVDKNKKAISTMRSNTKNDVIRKQTNTQRINSIVQSLD